MIGKLRTLLFLEALTFFVASLVHAGVLVADTSTRLRATRR